ncbi:hypothetical protein [Clostridium coskatii]|uniref:DUF4376 domain-containing protein n=1 Tax=Clostridium coskatii TaxID=1705578 RepID=A0A166TTP1_9CLOT|nr:hypothetical protein [Clostridium coskatii]OAA94074.1 hypothetical protein WX73_03644 [Clostridium coskatii]OBR96636.1 hypothetical protein CLCOS_07980 [Clostridium coskatii]
MQQIGRRIYYDKNTGNVLLNTGEMQGADDALKETTIDEDFQTYKVLSQRNKDSVGVIQLEYGQLNNKFSTCTGYSIDTTKNPIDASAIIFTFTTPDASLQEVKQAKINELSQDCQNKIVEGFTSTAYQNTSKVYDSSLEDQSNITGNALSAVSKVAGVKECQQDKFYYHARGEEFIEWTANECLQLARDFKTFKEQQLIKNKQLQAYVNTLITVEEVQKVTWDTVIPTA